MMDSYSIHYTYDALQDLEDIYDYISLELGAHGVAVAQIKRIRDEIRSLSAFPKRYKAVEWEPWSSQGMRQLPVDNFIIFYIVGEEMATIDVVRIIYGKRDIPNIIKTSESD